MKKQPALLFPFLATGPATSAVTQPGGGGGGGSGKSNWSNQNGTKEQETEDVSNVQLAAVKKEKLTTDETKDKSKVLKEAAYDKIRTLLTSNQQEIFDKSFKDRQEGKRPEEARALPPAATRAPPA